MKSPTSKTSKKNIRQKAEELLIIKTGKSTVPLNSVDTLKLIYELEVHQIELELQKQELALAKSASQEVADKYTELYDFAPVGYFTLSKDGKIIALNLLGSQMLGKERSKLNNKLFALFLSDDSKPVFDKFIREVFSIRVKASCEATLLSGGSSSKLVLITAIVSGNGEQCFVTVVDIAEHRNREAELEKSHSLLVNLARMVPGVIYQYRLYPDGRSAFPYSSPGMNDVYEYSPEELLEDATPVFGRIHPEDYDHVSDSIQKSADTLETFYCEFRVILPKQGLRWRWSQAQPERTEDGGTLWHGIISDITDHKLAEIALKESDEKFVKAFQTSPYTITITSVENGEFIEVNDTFTSMTGFTREEALTDSSIGMKLWKDIEDRNRVVSSLLKGNDVMAEEFLFKAKNDRIITGLFSARLIHLNNKDYILSSINDISDKKLAEEALHKSLDRNQIILQTAMDGFWVVDIQGRLLEVNDAYCRMSGYNQKELLVMSISDLEVVEDANDTVSHIQKIMKKGEDRFETKHRSKDGTIFNVEIRVKFLEIDGGTIVGFLHDITRRKQDEMSLLKKLDELEWFNKMMIDREVKMIDLKKEINALLNKLGENDKYIVHEKGE